MRKRLKKITVEKITIRSKPRRILKQENVSTFFPFKGMRVVKRKSSIVMQ